MLFRDQRSFGSKRLDLTEEVWHGRTFVSWLDEDSDHDTSAIVDMLMNNMQFHCLLLTVNPVFAGMMKMELHEMVLSPV